MLACAAAAALPSQASDGARTPAAVYWAPTGAMTQPRGFQSATLLPSGQVLVAGGDHFGGSIDTASADLYNPATGTFTPTGRMTTPRQWHTATLLPNGKVLIAGGSPCQGCYPLATAELYDPATGTFTATGSMHTIRAFQTATLLPTGQVLLAGGCVNVSGACYPARYTLASAELYNPWTGRFTLTHSMTVPRYNHTATLLRSGLVLLAGGANGQNGGQIGGAVASAELYNPWTGRFTATAAMNEARDVHTATRLPDGSVLVAGGCSDSSGSCNPPISATAEVFK